MKNNEQKSKFRYAHCECSALALSLFLPRPSGEETLPSAGTSSAGIVTSCSFLPTRTQTRFYGWPPAVDVVAELCWLRYGECPSRLLAFYLSLSLSNPQEIRSSPLSRINARLVRLARPSTPIWPLGNFLCELTNVELLILFIFPVPPSV